MWAQQCRACGRGERAKVDLGVVSLYLCRLSLTSELGGDHDYDCCIPRLIHSCPLTPPHHFVAMLEIRPFVPARFEFSIINQLVIN